MDLMDTLGYNTSLAEALAQAHALTGTWRSITANLRAAEALTSSDVQEVCGCQKDIQARRCRLGEVFAHPSM
jgi:predicted Zn-dependent peptidase